MIRPLLLAAALALPPFAARAAETGGCGRFGWDLREEHGLLDKAAAATGPDLKAVPAAAALALLPFASAALPKPPERQPKDPASFAGFVTVPVAEPGLYRVTLSADAWVDAVQAGSYRRPEAFSGVGDCAGMRKSLKFRMDSGPVILQVSGAAVPAISLAVTRDR